MRILNADISEILNKTADLLEIENANPFRVRAYRNAARVVESLPQSLSEMVETGKNLAEIPEIGDKIAVKLREIVETGTLSQLAEIEKKTPAELTGLMKIAGLGPKRIGTLYRKLGIRNLNDLRSAAEAGKVREIAGFGEKTEQTILDSIGKMTERERPKLAKVEEIARSLIDWLKALEGVGEIVVAGSFRRRCETVGDLDVLAICKEGVPIMERFTRFDPAGKVVSMGSTRSTVVLRSGLQVDLRVVPAESYGAALHYFTGSKAHNIAIRKLGIKKNLKINEYGIFRDDVRIGGETEKELFAMVDLPYIEPELREDRGEIEAARENRLPVLITLDRIRGDLHTHTRETDGRNSLEEMVSGARERGYAYLAITEHSKRLAMAMGMDETRLRAQMKQIDRLNRDLDDFIVLKSLEVDIMEDGSLDLPDDLLKELDLRICSVHYKFNLSREKQTERIIRAMDNPLFNILGHPTGRVINAREPYDVDVEKLIEAARDRGCFLELNAHPDRLDLPDRYLKLAKEMNVKIAVSTDAHETMEFSHMRFGVDQARRGWLEPGDVINTRSWEELKALIGRK